MPRAIVEATQDKWDVAPEREQAVVRLQEIPNVGPKMAAGLIKLGVTSLEDVAGRDPDEMYYELCAIDAKRHDPCVRDISPLWSRMPTAARRGRGGSSLRRGRHGNRLEERERDEVRLHHGRMRRGVDRQGVEVADACVRSTETQNRSPRS
jgi:Pathogenicity locus